MKKFFVMFTVLLLTAGSIRVTPAEEESKSEPPKVVAQGAILMDYETGRVLWGKNENEPMAMASTTKIMTAILAIESGRLSETVVASARAASAPEVKMGLRVGEEHTLEDLLYPLMLRSSNDAAIAIAEHLGGTVEDFCKQMTEKAAEIGAKDTVFETPNGLDKGDHHSTAYDMALITRYALQNSKFRQVAATLEKDIPARGEKGRAYTIISTDRLLREYEGALGVKSGFTGKAGQCFVGAAERDDMTLISVVLASGWGTAGKEQKWKDTKNLLNYGFQNYKKKTVVRDGDNAGRISVEEARPESVGLRVMGEITLPVTAEEEKKLRVTYLLPESLEAPVKAGDVAGSAQVTLEGKLLAETDIVTTEEAFEHNFLTSLLKIINHWLNVGGEVIM